MLQTSSCSSHGQLGALPASPNNPSYMVWMGDPLTFMSKLFHSGALSHLQGPMSASKEGGPWLPR